MQVRLGDLVAKCPYCEHTEFVASDDDDRELVCERCGGYASREVVLERLAAGAGGPGKPRR
ncbi:MAG TPA: hypothetical protein VM489_06140 [Burkholderiales bacterium]|jgi:transcription initiation factor TFIIIB Brf1 subunit/transcription initiation factor TFIIB|nr:hypothetical protein [Burkholderiales bacterium]